MRLAHTDTHPQNRGRSTLMMRDGDDENDDGVGMQHAGYHPNLKIDCTRALAYVVTADSESHKTARLHTPRRRCGTRSTFNNKGTQSNA